MYMHVHERCHNFYVQEDFVNILKDNGLCKIQLETIAGGTVAIYKGFKPLKKDKIMYQEVVQENLNGLYVLSISKSVV